MESLDEFFGAETSPVDLNTITGTDLPKMVLPAAAVRNRAATTALLSDNPSAAIDSYQVMVAEGARGESTIVDSMQNKTSQRIEQDDMKSYMSILGDPSIPYERKQVLLQNMKDDTLRKDSGMKLLTNAAQQPSKGESPDADRARTNSIANLVQRIHKDRQERQSLVNAFAASRDDLGAGGSAAAIAAMMIPTGEGQFEAGLDVALKGETSLWEKIKTIAQPGTAKMSRREALESMPLDKRVEATRLLIAAIESNQNLMFPSDNHFIQIKQLREMTEEGGYGNTDKWIDNFGAVADIIGLGGTVRRLKDITRPSKAIEAAGAGKVAPSIPEATVGLPKASPEPASPISSITARPTAGAYDGRIAELEAKKSALLGEAGNQLDRGQVATLTKEKEALLKQQSIFQDTNSIAKDIQAQEEITSKAAKAKAVQISKEKLGELDAQIQRIDGQLETNAKASTLTQSVADLEKKIATLQKNNTEVFLKKTVLADEISRIETGSVVRNTHPVSPHETLKLANPEQARNTHNIIFGSTDDSIAEGLAGVSKTQAITNDVYPQVLTSSGKVAAQPVDIQRGVRQRMQEMGNKFREHIYAGGRLEYTQQEKAAVQAQKWRDFQSAEGLVMNESMGGFATTAGNRINISAVYGTSEGAFSNAQSAMDQAVTALRKQGVLPEEIEILAKRGLDYEPVSLADIAGTEGSYMVRVNTYHDIDPTDVAANYEKQSVRFNWADRIPSTQWGDHGSLSRYIADAASMLSPVYSGAAVVATDLAAKFEKLLMDHVSLFSNQLKQLPSDAKERVHQYIKEANYNGWAFDPASMSVSMTPAEISTVKAWRDFWDGHFYLENLDLVRTFNAQGFQLFKNKNADLFVKQTAKDSTIRRVYDPAMDKVVELSRTELDELYNKQGFYGKLRSPTEFDGELVEHIIVRNTPTEYARKFRDSDQVLNYKEGYYQLQYKAPRFVDEITIGANGKEIRRAIAVAGDTPEAERFAQRMNDNAPPMTVYEQRADDRALQRGSDDWFDINQAGGRIAQRHRGKLLEHGAGLNHLGDGSYVLDPAMSAVRAARSIAGRTVNRPMLDAAKGRFSQQYGQYLQEDKFGNKLFPSHAGEIGKKGMISTKEVADARTTFGYIRYLENGYINGIDKMYKEAWASIAEAIGNVGKGRSLPVQKTIGGTQRGINAIASVAPAEFAKGATYSALIANHPLRQLVVQMHQGVRTWAYNPKGWASGRIPNYVSSYMFDKIGIAGPQLSISAKEAKQFNDFVEESGMLHAIDKQNLTRGFLMDAAESSNAIVNKMSNIAQIPRKYGFDKGEEGNTLAHLAAAFERYKRKGEDLSNADVRAAAHSEARAISYDMNFAGDMPYNQTAAALLLQFLQVPHKAFLQAINRRIPADVRARLIVSDMLMWGGPTTAVGYLFGGDVLPDNPKLREFFLDGLESFMINEAIRSATKDSDAKVDFSSLSPYGWEGWAEMFHAFFAEGPIGMLSHSPAGQMFSPEGRVLTAAKSVMRYFGVIEPIDETPQELQMVITDVLSIASGFSAGMKAHAALKYGERRDKQGNVTDVSTTTTEAVFEALGFGDGNRKEMFYVSKRLNENSKEYKKEVLKDIKAVEQYVAKTLGEEDRDVEKVKRVNSFLLSRYANSPVAMDIIRGQLSMTMKDPNTRLIEQMMKAENFPNKNSNMDLILRSPISEEQKQLLIQRSKDMDGLRNEAK